MADREFEIEGEEEWKVVVEYLAPKLEAGNWIRLVGDLGAGKTTFVRALLRHWGFCDPVPSPTYTLMNTYEIGKRKIIHIDGFRLKEGSDPWDSNEFLEAIVLCEWAEKTRLSPDKFQYTLTIELNEGQGSRRVSLSERAIG